MVPESVKALVKVSGQDFLVLEQMQTDVQQHLRNKNKAKDALRSPEEVDNYKSLQLSEFQEILDSSNPYVRAPHMGKILESPKEGIIAKALLMGPIVCDA